MPVTRPTRRFKRMRPAPKQTARGRIHGARRWKRIWSGLAVLASAPATAHASLISGEALDKAADVIAIFAIFFVPVVLIALFLYVHILPEKIADRRHHPQKAAIKALCLMSLAFGGLLWPLAWLWAYSRPVAYKLAYGTEKHEDYFREAGEQAEKGVIAPALLDEVRLELDGLAARGQLTPELRSIRDRLAAFQGEPAAQAALDRSQPRVQDATRKDEQQRGTL